MRSLVISLGIAVAGCSFQVSGVRGNQDGGGNGDDLATSGDDLGGAGGSGGADLATGNDIAGLPIVCTAGAASCSGSTLTTCPDGTAEVMTTCPLGCSSSGGAHCNALYPRAPITRADFNTASLTPVTFSVGGGISTDSGLIGSSATPLRHQNSDPNSYEVHDGIGFHAVAIPGRTTKVGIYTFKSMTLDQMQALNAYGTNALALVSAGDMTIDGTIDVTCAGNVFVSGLGGPGTAKVYLSGPGGGAGGQPGASNSGVGAQTGGGGTGADNAHQAGGGGGAYADIGGTGGSEGANPGGAGGSANGDPGLTVLAGGSGGGAGGQGNSANGSFGGGGGGLVLLVAQGTLTVGAGTTLGGINAGGCGGTADNMVGGGGGGSGGAILLQALSVNVAAMGAVAANGGGGSAANALAGTSSNGKSGDLSTGAAAGGSGGSASGGAGGAASTVAGQTGGSSGNSGAGAGGSAGRVRIETQAGAATIGGVQSPAASQAVVDIH